MAGRKRKLPRNFVPEPWLEPVSDEDGEWRPVRNMLLFDNTGTEEHERAEEERRYEDDNEEEEEHGHEEEQEEEEEEHEHEEEEEEEEEEERGHEEEEHRRKEEEEEHEHEQEKEAEEEVEQETMDMSELADDDMEFPGEQVDRHDTNDDANYHSHTDTQDSNADNDMGEHDSTHDDTDMEIENDTFESFKSVHENLVKDWISVEIDHHVSKAASNAFWIVADKFFHRLYEAKKREGITRKIPQFVQERNKLYDNKVPDISMKVAYKHNVTGEISMVEATDSIPTSQHPPNLYTKIYEVASVEVIIISFHKKAERRRSI